MATSASRGLVKEQDVQRPGRGSADADVSEARRARKTVRRPLDELPEANALENGSGFGPLMRFVAGTAYAARSVARHVLAFSRIPGTTDGLRHGRGGPCFQ